MIDRESQLAILKALEGKFPDAMGITAIQSHLPMNVERRSDHALRANLVYLAQHRLIQIHKAQDLDDEISAAITMNGIDFLADDGGLSAILGVVTIRLDDETVKALIENRIHTSDLPQPDKQRFLDQLRSLPADATKHMTMKLIDLGLANAPIALSAIRTFLESYR